MKAPAIIASCNRIAAAIDHLHDQVGIEVRDRQWLARPWKAAAIEAGDAAYEVVKPVARIAMTTAIAVSAVRGLGPKT
jgi:uncharacterized protein YcbX